MNIRIRALFFLIMKLKLFLSYDNLINVIKKYNLNSNKPFAKSVIESNLYPWYVYWLIMRKQKQKMLQLWKQ